MFISLLHQGKLNKNIQMVEHIFHICQLSHMKWILSLILECQYWILSRYWSSACGPVKDTERNLLGDSFRKQHLLYYI